jgi:hypothetical protein
MTTSADLDIPLTGTGDEEIEHQRHLSLRWQPRRHWPALRDEFGVNEATAAVILALVTSKDWVSYSRHKPHYSPPRRYRSNLYTYRRVVGAADHLDRLHLIEHDRTPPGLRGWQSSMKATPELIAITNEIISAGPQLEIARPPETIILRGKDGLPIDYRDTVETRRMRRRTEELNQALRSTDISDGAASSLVRIFNRHFGRGGRFYALGGGWQSMNKEARTRITIDGEPVVEIDYKTLHPALLYAQAGVPLPEDCYVIDGWPRKLIKLALLIIINAKNKQSARLALAHHDTMAEIAVPGSQEAIAVADKLIDDVKRVHKPIARAFHKDMGAALMRIDSTLAESIMMLMLRQGVVALPVHDSFLVPESKADLLEEAMLRAAHEAGFMALRTDYDQPHT